MCQRFLVAIPSVFRALSERTRFFGLLPFDSGFLSYEAIWLLSYRSKVRFKHLNTRSQRPYCA